MRVTCFKWHGFFKDGNYSIDYEDDEHPELLSTSFDDLHENKKINTQDLKNRLLNIKKLVEECEIISIGSEILTEKKMHRIAEKLVYA